MPTVHCRMPASMRIQRDVCYNSITRYTEGLYWGLYTGYIEGYIEGVILEWHSEHAGTREFDCCKTRHLERNSPFGSASSTIAASSTSSVSSSRGEKSLGGSERHLLSCVCENFSEPSE